MTNKIICTTDFSDSSKEALRWSVEWAKKTNSRLTVLYTYRLIKQGAEPTVNKRKIEEEASQNMTKLEKELLVNSGIEYDIKIEVGFVEDRVEEHLKTNQISFLVMGKEMSLRNKEMFDDLLQKLQVPLVIVP